MTTDSRDTDWHPAFIVIGAAKAATTWIQMQLQANPAIFMPDPEPHFFSREFEKSLEFYESFFSGRPATGALIGEKSADYLSHDQAAERIAAMLPKVRLVVQLRDPVERAYSDYKMLFRRGTVRGQPEEYLSSLDNPQPRFLNDGLYGEHLSRWLDHFDREQIFAFRFEDVERDPEQVVRSTSQHIGAKAYFDPGLADKHENSSQSPLLPLPIRKALAPLKDSVRPVRGTKLFEGARSLLARQVAYPPLRPDLRERMTEFYQKDIERAEKLLDLDLSHWKVPASEIAA
ncbi:sulfotransferase family protein [Altererythrobacter sp. Root672]|uniref:sulfotransferase family protein n=1 Tax=Altererythrobacter sp. Root672 TaxID=1736584 RepID=UPI0006FD3295|nr:sulfotransferase [Altererythrobacter sp. Root672]KRA83610.1 sulfotransferase [Altererythrobacter sp. Root672]